MTATSAPIHSHDGAQLPILITGANRGIGLATALALVGRGVDVVGTYRTEHPDAPEHRDAAGPAARPRARLRWVRADMESRSDLEMLAEIEISGLVANAGQPYISKIQRTSLDNARSFATVNLSSAAFLAESAARRLAGAGGGSVVLVSSVSACYGILGAVMYGGAKAGLVGCARRLGRLYGPAGVEVHTVAPGYVETRVTEDLALHVRSALVERHVPAARFADPREIGACLARLVTSAGQPSTGRQRLLGPTLIPLDGGFAMGWR